MVSKEDPLQSQLRELINFLVKKNFHVHYGDLTDTASIQNLINIIKPDEIYNLAAQSHVGVSFYTPLYTANVNAIGVLAILDAIRNSKKNIRFYQAGTSEMFGKTKDKLQNEKTKFNPQSPYGTAKLFAHHITQNYRDAYNIFACNGILFNHESPLRGENFVTKKIISTLTKIKYGFEKNLHLEIYTLKETGVMLKIMLRQSIRYYNKENQMIMLSQQANNIVLNNL